MRGNLTAIFAGSVCLALLLVAGHVDYYWGNRAVLLGKQQQQTQKLAYDGPYDTPPVTWYFPGANNQNTLGYNWNDVQYQQPTVIYQPGVMTDNGIATTTAQTVGFDTGDTTTTYPLGYGVNYQYATSEHNSEVAAAPSGVIYQYNTMVPSARKQRQAALAAGHAQARQQALTQIDMDDTDVVAGLKDKLRDLDGDDRTSLTERLEKDKAILDSSKGQVSLSIMANQLKDLGMGQDEDAKRNKEKRRLVMKHATDNNNNLYVSDDLSSAVMSAIKNHGIDVVNVAPADAPKPNFEAIATAIHQPGPKQSVIETGLGGNNIYVFGNLNMGQAAAADSALKIKGPVWSYNGVMTGPDYWSELDPSYGVCDRGTSQSPINLEINIQRDRDLSPLKWNGPTDPYEATLVPPSFTNTFTVDGLKGNMQISGLKMKLKKMTFHTPSEHRLNGKPMQGEIQFIHQAHVESSSVGLVVSAFLQLGDETAPFLRTTLEGIRGFAAKQDPDSLTGADWDPPQYEMDVKPSIWFSTQELAEGVLGYGNNYANYYTYMGSLSQPPCTEGVTWIIVKKPIVITPDDYAILAYLQGYTARPTQRTHRRAVYETASARSSGS